MCDRSHEEHVIALSLLIAAAAPAAAPTVEEVGDADSFGRDVVYLGSAQTANVALQADCTPDPMAPPPPPNDRCIVLNAQPATTTFVEDGLATMQLPADSTKSLICFALTPNVFKKPMTFTFGAQGSMRIVDFANYFYGIRLYRDSKDNK